MHDTAYNHGRLFFELYGCDVVQTVVELGSQDVNGSLRDHCPPGAFYIGLDLVPANGVDLVVSPAGPLPLASDIADAVLTSSAFEHDICFWDTFLELVRILRPGGLLYVNVPSNGGFHRHPLDCWRFYPDAGVALVRWAERRGHEIALVESFIGQPQDQQWADFVAVFRKAGGGVLSRRGRIADRVSATNIYDIGMRPGAELDAETETMPDMRTAASLRTNLSISEQRNESLSADVAAVLQRNAMLSDDLAAARDLAAGLREAVRVADLRTKQIAEDLAQAHWQLDGIRNSTSWRMTAGLRQVMRAVRGR